jgi:hypothetical protein
MRPLRCWRGHVRRTTCRPFRSAAILAVKLGRLRRWQNSGAVGSRRCVSSMCTSTEVLSPLGATWYRGRGSGKGIQENDDQPHAGASQEPAALRAAPRCGARTRSGSPCRSPIVNGEKRCRMHGGAVGSGAPKGGRTATGSTVITAASFARRSGCSGWWPELPDSPAVRPIPPEAHTEMPRHDSSRSCSFACSLAASHRRLDGRETRHWLWAGVEMMQRLKPGITKRDQTT